MMLEKQMRNPSRNTVQAVVDTVYIYKNEVCKSAYKHLSPSLFKEQGIIQMEKYNPKVKEILMFL